MTLALRSNQTHSLSMTWTSDQSEHLNHYVRLERSGSTDLYMEADSLEVTIINGRGYCREETTSYIPMEVLLSMLQHQGFKVTK